MRDEVLWFALQMEKVLARNDSKGGWNDCTYEYLLRRLEEEVLELKEEYARYTFAYDTFLPTRHKKEKLIKEAVDVANFAMMIADNAKNNMV